MIKLALLGKNIQHSKSPEMYRKIYDTEIEYTFFDYSESKNIPSLSSLFKNIDGLSITAPYKEHFLDDVILDDEIKPLKAINCIKKSGNDYFGTNTDYTAMIEILEEMNFLEKEVILLGDGAMARITKIYLDSVRFPYTQLSRKRDGDLVKLDFNRLKKSDKDLLVINACGRSYSFAGEIPKNSTFWDYNYSQEANSTYLSSKCNYVDGLDLLYRQAVHATKFWNLTF